MTDSEMDLTILLKQRDKEIARLKADLRATRAQHTADLASTASVANDLVSAEYAVNLGATADIVGPHGDAGRGEFTEGVRREGCQFGGAVGKR